VTSVDYFYFSLGTGFTVLVVCAVFVSVEVVRILKDVREVSEKVSGVATDVSMLKDGIKMAIMNLVQNFLEKAMKGGVHKDGKQKE
jgi:division protein CdvB (Snf7/Vps24/ESCRT-III family)